jgi:DNA-binding MarR family transcriptional regulator
MVHHRRVPEFEPLDPHAQLGYLLVVCAERMSREWHAALRSAGINPRQFSMLAVIARDPGISQAELARQVLITAQSVSESLTRLVDAGLVERSSATPGKAAQLVLTAAGRQVLESAYPVVTAFNDAHFAALSARERETLARALRKLMHA